MMDENLYLPPCQPIAYMSLVSFYEPVLIGVVGWSMHVANALPRVGVFACVSSREGHRLVSGVCSVASRLPAGHGRTYN